MSSGSSGRRVTVPDPSRSMFCFRRRILRCETFASYPLLFGRMCSSRWKEQIGGISKIYSYLVGMRLCELIISNVGISWWGGWW